MTCPKCMGTDVETVGNSHYICKNPNCSNNGERTQFRVVEDDYIRFPYNQIFVSSSVHQFFRKPYLELENVGNQGT